MRVLMLTSSYPLAPGDWRGVFVRDLARALARDGMTVDVAAPRPEDGRTPEPCGDDALEPAVVWLPSFLHARSSAFHGAGIEANLKRRPWAIASLPPFLTAFTAEAVLRTLFADVIVAHWLVPMGLVGAALARASGRPLVVVAHSGPPPLANLPPLRYAIEGVVASAAVVACVSESVAAQVVPFARPGAEGRIRALGLGVDLRPAPPRPAAPGRPLDLLFAGRLVPIKGVDVLLRAIEGLDGVRLTIAGDGPEGTALRRQAADRGVDARFLGEVPNAGVLEAMLASDALVVPSRDGPMGRREGLPRVLLEAWACGLPVVASTTGGLAEVSGEPGLLAFPPGDARMLRDRVVALRDGMDLRGRLREGALAAAASRSWTVVGPRWASLVRDAAIR